MRSGSLAIAGCCVLLLLPAPSLGAWSGTPIRVASGQVASYDLATANSRFGIAAWSTGRISISPSDGNTKKARQATYFALIGKREFGEGIRLAHGPVESVDVTASSRDFAAVAWRQSRTDALRSATISRSGRILARQKLARHVAANSDLVMSPSGKKIGLAWVSARADGTKTVKFARMGSRRGFGRPQVVSRQKELGLFPPAVAMSAGASIVLWPGACSQGLRERARASIHVTGAGRFGKALPIPGSACPDSGVDVALRRNGTALALFSGSKSGLGGIRLSAGSVKGFTRARRVSGKGEEADFGAIASLGPSSEAVVWNRYVSGEPAGVIAAQIGKGPSVGEPELLSGAEPASSAQLEISADGTLVASWQSLRSYRLKAAVACRGEWFNDTETITKPLIANAITRAKVAVSGAGFGAALWSEPTSRGDLGLFGSRRTGDGCETN